MSNPLGAKSIQDIAAVILAGGESLRMGRDKSLLNIEGIPLIQSIQRQLSTWFDQIIISADDPGKYSFLKCPVIPDQEPDQGPLMAIYSVLQTLKKPIFVVATDIPRLPGNILSQILRLAADNPQSQAIVPVTAAGEFEPLFAIYRPEISSTIQTCLQSGQRHIHGLFAQVPHTRLELKSGVIIPNLNDPDDIDGYLKLRRRGASF